MINVVSLEQDEWVLVLHKNGNLTDRGSLKRSDLNNPKTISRWWVYSREKPLSLAIALVDAEEKGAKFVEINRVVSQLKLTDTLLMQDFLDYGIDCNQYEDPDKSKKDDPKYIWGISKDDNLLATGTSILSAMMQMRDSAMEKTETKH